MPPRLILASGSTYRRDLLARLRLPFETMVPDINETPLPSESPDTTAVRLAQQKAEAVAGRVQNALVIGSDQVAILDLEQIGKPGNHENALQQLKKMRGRKVVFHTGVCLYDSRRSGPDAVQLTNVQTTVTFRSLNDDELDAYLKIEQPYDCAGSAKKRGLGYCSDRKY